MSVKPPPLPPRPRPEPPTSPSPAPVRARTIIETGNRPKALQSARIPTGRQSASPTPAPIVGPAKRCPTCKERFPIDYNLCPRDGAQLEVEVEDERDPYLGTTLAQTYRIMHRVGIGGMGAVYEATHTRLPARKFAVKVMHRELAHKGDLAVRFRREAEVAVLAKHANVMEVVDIDETSDAVPFIVAELLEGKDLGQLLDEVGTLGLEQTVHVVRQLCAALQAVHKVGVVHRDLKPDNVFLVGATDPSARPVVKLLDFGIARLNDAGAGQRTRTGVVMGTPAYMAPEQARGERVDHRCDVYAVGAILYRCLTGRSVYDDEDPAATLNAVLTREPERPRAVMPSIPETVEIVIERAIARDPEERFQDMLQLDAALAGLVAPSETAPVRAGTGEVPALDAGPDAARLVQRARPTLAVATLLGFVLAVGTVSDLLAQIVAAISEEGVVTSTEGALAVAGVIAALATPAGLWIRHLLSHVWRNSLRAVTLARRMVTTIAAGASAYAFVLLASRVLDLVVSDAPGAPPGLLTTALACVTSWGVVALTLMSPRPVRRREDTRV
jgi:hypothetical protein